MGLVSVRRAAGGGRYLSEGTECQEDGTSAHGGWVKMRCWFGVYRVDRGVRPTMVLETGGGGLDPKSSD